MTATNHVVTGALVATFLHNPWVALPVALASHFAVDALPHFDYPAHISDLSLNYFIWLAADCALAASILAALLLLRPDGVILLVACGIAGALPDSMWLYYLVAKKGDNKEKWPFIVTFHAKIQKYTSAKLWPVELAWFLVAGSLLATRLY